MATIQIDDLPGYWRRRFTYCSKNTKRSDNASVRRQAEDPITFP
jgi:hypothetical protein